MNWTELNDKLRKTQTEAEAQALFEAERRGLKRRRWLKRIHSRYARLRSRRERKELERA